MAKMSRPTKTRVIHCRRIIVVLLCCRVVHRILRDASLSMHTNGRHDFATSRRLGDALSPVRAVAPRGGMLRDLRRDLWRGEPLPTARRAVARRGEAACRRLRLCKVHSGYALTASAGSAPHSTLRVDHSPRRVAGHGSWQARSAARPSPACRRWRPASRGGGLWTARSEDEGMQPTCSQMGIRLRSVSRQIVRANPGARPEAGADRASPEQCRQNRSSRQSNRCYFAV